MIRIFWSEYNFLISSTLKICIHFFFLDGKNHSLKRKNKEIEKEQLKNTNNVKHGKSNDDNYINKSNSDNKNNRIQSRIDI